jgi:hypothetical protein
MAMYWKQSASGLQEENFDTNMEDEDFVTQTTNMGQ